MNEPKHPNKRSADDILREMETIAQENRPPSIDSPKNKDGGALKSLLNFFIKVVPEAETPAPSALEAPPVRVADVALTEDVPKFETDANVAQDLSQKSFDEIYREAGLIEDANSISELETLLNNPTIANQPISVKIVAVNLALSAKGVSIEKPISDAMRRDRALDAYQKMLLDRSHAIDQKNALRVQEISRETEEYLKRKQAEIDALRAEIAEANRQSVDFSMRREAEEKRLADIISPFLQGKPNPVTVQSSRQITKDSQS